MWESSKRARKEIQVMRKLKGKQTAARGGRITRIIISHVVVDLGRPCEKRGSAAGDSPNQSLNGN